MKLDLHLHSHASDGRVAPEEVVRAAARAGLDAIALTDHDTAGGVRTAQSAARDEGIVVVAGIEVSTREPEGEFHILGLFIDPDAPGILRHQTESAARRRQRMHHMTQRLQALGVPITFDEVLASIEGEPYSLGRPHLARALLAAGHVRSFGEAFDRFLRDEGPAFVPTEFPSALQAIRTIHEAGGLAIWAHPPIEVFDTVIPRFASFGLDGVECFRPNTPDSDSAHLFAAAQALGLFASGGSDWHGPHHQPLGTFYLTERQIPELAARIRGGRPAPDADR